MTWLIACTSKVDARHGLRGQLVGLSCNFGYTRYPIGRTPAQEGTVPVNLNHGDSLGASRSGRRDDTSVGDLR
eukprot:6179842-Pleurochrysis_carterae.AAC.4